MLSMTDLYLNVRQSERILANTCFAEKALRATRRWKLCDDDRTILKGFAGLSEGASAFTLSNSSLRSASCRALVDSFREYWEASLPVDVPAYFFTFTCDVGFTSDRLAVIRLRAFRRMLADALRQIGLSGISQLEIQAVVNYPQQGAGRTLILHAHSILWGVSKLRAIRTVIDELNADPRWSNPLSATPIVCRRLKGGMFEALPLCYYLDKMPIAGKNRVPYRKKPGEYRFRDTMAGYRPELALRVMEALSQISMFDAVVATGDGVHVRRAWESRLAAAFPQLRRPDRDYLEDVALAWTSMREMNGSKNFLSINLIG